MLGIDGGIQKVRNDCAMLDRIPAHGCRQIQVVRMIGIGRVARNLGCSGTCRGGTPPATSRRCNRWLYPDVVAMEDLGAEWLQEVRDCVNQYSDKRTKLWSFEVKLLLNRSNVRECFFQAVSNSSWANLGYLVAAEIEGQDTLKELRMLFAAHGVGLIKLDADKPAESEVLIPARERDEIDWDMANRLATENRDFLEYVKLVKQFYQTGEARLTDWDVPEVID